MNAAGQDAKAIHALVAELESDESIVVETVQTMLATVPGYGGVPSESIQASVRRNITLSIRTILDGRAPSAEQIDEAEALATERLAQGVPLGSVLSGFRVSMSVILHHLLELSPRFGIPAAEVLSFSTLLWGLADAFSARALRVFQDHDIAAALTDSARRDQWVADVVVRGVAPADLRHGADLYGIPTDSPVRALSIARRRRDQDAITPAVAWAEAGGARLVAAARGRGAVGLLVGEPDPATAPEQLIIARGPLVPLESLPESYAVATRVLETAEQVGFTGLVDRSRLSWRMGITASPETTAHLTAQLLEPLRAEGAFGELIIEALTAYLEHGLNIPRAAAAIPVHVNTLRYRLRRLEDLLEASLQDLDTLFELSWAVAAAGPTAGSGATSTPHAL